MSEIVLPDDTPRFIEEMADVEEAGKLRQKGYSFTDISDKMECSPARAKELVDEYRKYIKYSAEQDPYFLEKTQLNTLSMLSELEDISKEAWESVEIATQHGMVSARTQAIKLALEILSKKSQLFQLTGQQGTDTDYIARMQKAELVNQVVTKIIREIVAECPRCSELSRVQLAEAFEIMSEDENVEDAVVVDEDFTPADTQKSDENEPENSDENVDENGDE
jgi:hypothetical protein